MFHFGRCAAVLVLSLASLSAAGDSSQDRPFLSLLQPGQTVLVARFQFGFELVIVTADEARKNADAHLVTEIGKDYVVLEQGDWEKRIAASAIAVIGRKRPPTESLSAEQEGAAAAVGTDRKLIQGKWRIVSARVSGRDVELPDDVVWTFAGEAFLSGGYFPAAVEGQKDPARERFELAPRGVSTELAHVSFSVPRDRAADKDDEQAEAAESPSQFHAVDPATPDEARALNVLRISVTLKDGGRRKLEGVYSLTADTLTICLGAQRPANSLDTNDDDGLMLFVLERLPPA